MTPISRACLAAAGLLAIVAGAAPAAAFEPVAGDFMADRACPAPVSIRQARNPGDWHLRPGSTYAAHGLNKPGGSDVQVSVPGASPARRWVARTCGTLRLAEAQDGGPLLPFFDGATGPSDPSPAPPALSALDRAVLQLCGSWGSRPSAAAFRRMLDDPGPAAEVEAIRRALDNAVVGPARDAAAFRDDLTEAWFAADGFAHVFCGEPGADGLGGLHFAGRYLQMQQEGWGGLATACARAEIVPPIYTLGVRYLRPGGGMATACPKGYALTLDAGALFVAATRALRQMAGRPGAACLYRVAAPGQSAFLAVFVRRDGAIRSFYPDASPTCDGGAGAASCLCDAD
ncbi:MAG: EndoU domain-containing protein [Sneathiellaceae bacterium]